MKRDFCIVLMFDKEFVKKSWQTIKQIRGIGQYSGDIVCILANDLHNKSNLLYKGDRIIYKNFLQYNTNLILKHPKKIPEDSTQRELAWMSFPMKRKMIHYHKFYCFSNYFRENYRKCLYIDTGMNILNSLDKIINLDCSGKLLAHSNAHPEYEATDKLYTQFDSIIFPELYEELNTLFNLDINHFQATVMLYDTNIIEYETFDELIRLAYYYVNSKTNDQAILNLYFSCMKHVWQPLPIKDEKTYYYDFYIRGSLTEEDYIMIKYLQR